MTAIRDHHHTIQLLKQSDDRRIRFGYADDPSWYVQVYCSLTKSTYNLATFKSEADAVDFAQDKAIEFEIAWERLP